MTGFGKGSAGLNNGRVVIEIKTVNHKFFDPSLKLPENIAPLEDKIKEALQKRIKRGKVNLNLIYDGTSPRSERVSINKKLAKRYMDQLLQMKKHLGLKDDIGAKEILALPGVLIYEMTEKGVAMMWPKIKKALNAALDKLVRDRQREGKGIYRDLKKRADSIKKMLAVIEARAHLNIGEYRDKFAERIKDLSSGQTIDKGRLEMEVAIFAKNSDISEEITRLKNHLRNLKSTLAGNGEVGKKMDFIAQELHREINTIGSKASDFKISQNAIEIKSEIEKIREQAKNLE
jgi:uncharacterized protein (TIGR00255 family)